MNTQFDGSNGLQEAAQYGALEELDRLTEIEFAKPGNRGRALLLIVAVMAITPVIIAWFLL